ncbi:MAG: stage II sporulation protein R, partial [Peptostreptococcaceae bacterium]
DKMYGDVLFPQGEYEAFRILIGEAKGQNWWCVMFPPLCFVDESRQAVNTKETKENLDNGIEKNNEDTRIKKESRKKVERNSTEEEKIEFKLKIFEIFKEK